VFLDRDGVLVRPILRDGLPYAPLCWEDFAIFPGAPEAVSSLRDAGFIVVVVTNQPEVRRGSLAPELLEAFHQQLRARIPVHDVIFCPHDDRDGCPCRKPKPGMILQGAREHQIDLRRAWMVGDTGRDLGAAQAAGLPGVLIDAPYNQDLVPNHRVPDLAAAAHVILNTSL
jgi:D-glycero-D-manno-heptose 1,7-bisphosphate phosphatase